MVLAIALNLSTALHVRVPLVTMATGVRTVRGKTVEKNRKNKIHHYTGLSTVAQSFPVITVYFLSLVIIIK